jgi:copper chaperone CopZ
MKMVMKVEGECCPNCADKIERKISSLNGVDSATLAYMTQKLTLEISGDPESISNDVEKIILKTVPKAKITKV